MSVKAKDRYQSIVRQSFDNDSRTVIGHWKHRPDKEGHPRSVCIRFAETA